MMPMCKLCKKYLLFGELFLATPCGCVFHKTCIVEQIGKLAKCPRCESKLYRSALRSIYLSFYDNIHERTNDIKKAHEDQIHQLEKEQHKRNVRIMDLETKIKSLNASLGYKLKDLAACNAQLKDKETKLDSKTNDLITCEALLNDQKNLTKNLYELVKDDLKKCALMSAEEENLRRELESCKAHCAELETTVKDHCEAAMKETTLRKQFNEEVAVFEKKKVVMQKRISELEWMVSELLSTKEKPAAPSKSSVARKRELKHEPATGINESNTKRFRVSKNTKENIPASQRVLRSSAGNQLAVQKVQCNTA